MRTPARRSVLVAAALVAAACGSDKSIILAGNDDRSDHRPGRPDHARRQRHRRRTHGGRPADPQHQPAGRDRHHPARHERHHHHHAARRAARCPVDALDRPAGPVEITFWHGLNADNETAIIESPTPTTPARIVWWCAPRTRAATSRRSTSTSSRARTTDRPLVMFPEYSVQRAIDSGGVIPVGVCTEAAGYDLRASNRPRSPRTRRPVCSGACRSTCPTRSSTTTRTCSWPQGLDPDRPPQSLEELRQYSQQLVDSGAASYGIALDSGADSGGGWFIEQWFANMGELYADNGNGRLAPGDEGAVRRPGGCGDAHYVQDLINDGLAFYVGDNAGGADQLLKLADGEEPAAMAISTSAGLGTVLNTLAGGLVPDLGPEDVGVGPLPGPGARRPRWWAAPRSTSPPDKRRCRSGRRLGLRAVPRQRRDAVAVRDADRLRARARRRARGRASARRVRRRPAVPGRVRPARVVARFARRCRARSSAPSARSARSPHARSPRCSPVATCRPR